MMHMDQQFVTLIVGIVSGIVGFKANQVNLKSSKDNSATKLADIYAEHYPGLLNEIEGLRGQLNLVIQERDDLKDQVRGLSEQVEYLQETIDQLRSSLEENHERNI